MKHIVLFLAVITAAFPQQVKTGRTNISIRGERFYINDTITYRGRYWNGVLVEGLLFNSRMVQGIFDDLNPSTKQQFAYHDTKVWDPERNTDEFVAAMKEWRGYGLLAFTLNLQGGSPTGYGNKGWINSAFDETGNLRPDYLRRLEKILDRTDELGMGVILGLFYFGQDQILKDEAAVLRAVDAATDWIGEKGYRNLLIEINNECNSKSYDHAILKPERVGELILRVQRRSASKFRLPVGVSYTGSKIPDSAVVAASDFILLHGNGVKVPSRIKEMTDAARKLSAGNAKPVLFNEDDHYNFDSTENNFTAAVMSYASWGYFDFRREGESYEEGFQSVPVDWRVSTPRKRAFFNLLKEITGY